MDWFVMRKNVKILYMVVCVILCHGRYNSEKIETDVKVPYNIRLVQYTHPRTPLSPKDAYFILNQLIETTNEDVKHPTFAIHPNIIDTEINGSTYSILSPPYIKRIAKTKEYLNDTRVIGTVTQPQGRYKVYKPNSTTPNIDLEFKNEPQRVSDSVFLETKMIKQLNDNRSITDYYRMESGSRSIGLWLMELSCFYEKECPGKVIHVFQLSCRSDHLHPYRSVTELGHDFSRLSLEPTLKYGVNYRAGIEGVKRSKLNEGLFKDKGQFEFIHKYEPYIIRKSETVAIPKGTMCQMIQNSLQKGGKNTKTNRRRRRNTHRKQRK